MEFFPRALNGTFLDAAYQFLRTTELFVPRIYSDDRGIPTIGVGIALIIDYGNGWEFRRGYKERILPAAGISLTKADQDILNKALRNLTNKNGPANLSFIPKAYSSWVINWTLDKATPSLLKRHPKILRKIVRFA